MTRLAALFAFLALSGCIADTTPAASPATPAAAVRPAAKKAPPAMPSSVDFGRRQ